MNGKDLGAIEQMQREVAADLTRFQYRGDEARRTRVAEMLVEVMVAVEAGSLPEARAAMQRLVDWRETFRAQEQVEALQVQTERCSNWVDWRNALVDSGTLSDEVMDCLDEVVFRTVEFDDLDAWLDTYREMSFDAMLRREASLEEAKVLAQHATLRTLLYPEEQPNQAERS